MQMEMMIQFIFRFGLRFIYIQRLLFGIRKLCSLDYWHFTARRHRHRTTIITALMLLHCGYKIARTMFSEQY